MLAAGGRSYRHPFRAAVAGRTFTAGKFFLQLFRSPASNSLVGRPPGAGLVARRESAAAGRPGGGGAVAGPRPAGRPAVPRGRPRTRARRATGRLFVQESTHAAD